MTPVSASHATPPVRGWTGPPAADAAGTRPGARAEEAEQNELARLKARDREVRLHERAHQTAGGAQAGAASFSFEKGPDGRSYAVEGEVPIDASPVRGDPEATIEKMQQVKRAALAPSQPSGQDRKVAARADAEVARARAEARTKGDGEDAAAPPGGRLSGALNQALADIAAPGPRAGPASASPDPAHLAAYASGAYRHPAPDAVPMPR